MGQLTAAGMRQRYLIGKEKRKRYMGQNNFLSDYLETNPVFIESTNVYRTIQSAYSQIMGMFPQEYAPTLNLTLKQSLSLSESPAPKRKVVLPFKVRNSAKIN
jgi:hypothetical protein